MQRTGLRAARDATHNDARDDVRDAALRAMKRSRDDIAELAEPDANITAYRPRAHPRIYGAFCQRWCDFHVHELDGPGAVVRLEALPSDPPEPETSEYVHFVLCKENRSTTEALQELASAAGVSPRAFGFRGSKDRRAITTQRVSARGVAPARLLKVNAKWTSSGSRVRIGHLRAAESALSLGEAAGNQFSIVLRDVAIDDEAHTGETLSVEAACAAAADAVATNGFVNYFGLQRFGRDAEVPTHAVGAAMLRRDWMGALLLVLAPTAPGLSPPARAALEAFAATRDARASLRLLPARKCATAAAAPPRLPRRAAGRRRGRRRGGGGGGGGGGGAADAAAASAAAMRERSAGAAVESNGFGAALAARRGRRRGRPRGAEPAAAAAGGGCEEEEEEGRVGDDVDGPARRRPDRGAAAAAGALSADEAASGKWSLHDVLVPLPGHAVAAAAPPVAEALAAALRVHGLDGADGAFWRQPCTFDLPGTYRPLLARPRALTAKCIAYDYHTLPLLASDLDGIDGERRPAGGGGAAGAAPRTALVVEFELPASAYATMLLRSCWAARSTAPSRSGGRRRRWPGRRFFYALI